MYVLTMNETTLGIYGSRSDAVEVLETMIKSLTSLPAHETLHEDKVWDGKNRMLKIRGAGSEIDLTFYFKIHSVPSEEKVS